MFKVFNSPYSPVLSRSESPLSDEEHRSFIDGKQYREDAPSESTAGFRNHIPPFSIILPWVLAVTNLGLFLHQYLRHPSELECARLLSPYSPAIDAGIVEYYDTNFQNEFGGRSEYTGPPTPELEERWDELWSRGTIELPLDGPAKLNKSTARLMHAQKDPARGYSAVLEVFHHLHCLNQIRQYTWKDYYASHMADWIAGDDHDIVDLNVTDHANVGDRMHVDHCIEALRLQLMCNADLTPLLIEVDDNELGQKADFNVHHKCRNWEKVTEWQDTYNVERTAKNPAAA
ncbi:hypothetical protein NUW58_g2671 [Xylaria curta]|uniref:Uncharacterized protein n=2 Tax=Xylaria curta TaxID=42375 RepID=A0ACC1NAM1_9PEZI|nr:hypothetical protein NUW58_g8325 [Xylaria curta]KAJ2991028.1 hypothetical protein NUW58_g2671 [Xylaria curta]